MQGRSEGLTRASFRRRKDNSIFRPLLLDCSRPTRLLHKSSQPGWDLEVERRQVEQCFARANINDA